MISIAHQKKPYQTIAWLCLLLLIFAGCATNPLKEKLAAGVEISPERAQFPYEQNKVVTAVMAALNTRIPSAGEVFEPSDFLVETISDPVIAKNFFPNLPETQTFKKITTRKAYTFCANLFFYDGTVSTLIIEENPEVLIATLSNGNSEVLIASRMECLRTCSNPSFGFGSGIKDYSPCEEGYRRYRYFGFGYIFDKLNFWPELSSLKSLPIKKKKEILLFIDKTLTKDVK